MYLALNNLQPKQTNKQTILFFAYVYLLSISFKNIPNFHSLSAYLILYHTCA